MLIRLAPIKRVRDLPKISLLRGTCARATRSSPATGAAHAANSTLLPGAMGVLVVCEVKARRSSNFGDPFEAITPAKIQRLRRATAAFVAARPSPLLRVGEIRFDAASVIGARVEVRESIV
ncbi:MAG: hypothetical protein ABR58_01190 [Acidimicrobium sp. BACL19 MAG-120924-bin39]|nr:MAG: hypothetical protein ABR58_01190 [Acidimicrobium sp. BACL19 MAG-120924-bin39]